MTLTTGALAKTTGVGIQTIRFYEREGLMEPAPRSPSGYRTYDDSAVVRLDFIRRAQQLGFTLKEIRELIGLESLGGAPCGKVRDAVSVKLESVESKIADLMRMRDALQQLVSSCTDSTPAPECLTVSSCFQGCAC